MTAPRPKSPPAGLKLAGRRFWKAVVSAYGLRLDELVLLDSACRTIDLLADLDVAMAGQPLTVLGSMGQQREHPLLSEARQQKALLARLLAQMKLPDLDEVTGAKPRSVQARAAAQSRWQSTPAPWN
jgi:hypothetical protein